MPSPPTTSPALSIKGLRFRYSGSGAAVATADSTDFIIDIPSFFIQPGEQVLLTANSGKGKSTLLQLIAGLLDPLSGTIEIAGRNMHALRGASRDLFRGRHIGMVFQTFNLLHGFTAAENVEAALLFSNIPASNHYTKAKSLLESLGIDRTDAMVDQLSVGQQQRVAVARAVATDPVLVLADEPTASLDPQNAATAMDLIQQACRDKGAALLCVSHDPSMVPRFQRSVRWGEWG